MRKEKLTLGKESLFLKPPLICEANTDKILGVVLER